MTAEMLSTDKTVYELKEKAKWSDNKQEKKLAIKQISTYGNDAVPVLEEVFNVTAYDEIRVACVDAINAIKNVGKTETITKKESITEA